MQQYCSSLSVPISTASSIMTPVPNSYLYFFYFYINIYIYIYRPKTIQVHFPFHSVPNNRSHRRKKNTVEYTYIQSNIHSYDYTVILRIDVRQRATSICVTNKGIKHRHAHSPCTHIQTRQQSGVWANSLLYTIENWKQAKDG